MLIGIFIVSVLIWLICWRRVYAYNQRKGSRKIVSHFLGIVMGAFPAYFFLYSATVTFLPSPNGVEMSLTDQCTIWGICILTILGIFYMTSRPIPQKTGAKTIIERAAMRSDVGNDGEAGKDGAEGEKKDNLKRDEGF